MPARTSDLVILARYRFSTAQPKGEWRYWIGKAWHNLPHDRAVKALRLRVAEDEAVAILAIARRYANETLVLEGK